ncbi:unknown protein [Microcystis aeruginosa NIES-843]|uniref:Uncharacterized protein n=1 Tax=Microcystis aeruginosa (strain NIES-843 / IAM M-2473) TaxID=449447 RepID=B0JQ31_MICAN|nr:unknown protein [Microcystis aeruginosa NIES-843]
MVSSEEPLFLLINILHNSYQVSKRATPLLPNHYRLIHGRTVHSPKFSNNSYFFIIRGLKTPLAATETTFTS